MADTPMKKLSLFLATSDVERAEALVAHLSKVQHAMGLRGSVRASTVIRAAVVRGLDVLEKERKEAIAARGVAAGD